jgi:hypothetical protein
MIKTTSPTDWNYGQSPFSLVKTSRYGFRSNDFRDFVKRAGDEAACRVSKLDQHARPGEDLLHLLAMGATEVISPNRNGDGWKQAILLESYPTFTKYAFWHRNHNVQEADGVYGRVRDSWYNHKMGRVELLVGLFSTKEAAFAGHPKRGRVADKELHMLNSDIEIPVSMSGLVPHDFCSGCGHQATGRKNYCKKSSGCKYGGLFHNIGRVFEDGHHLHADNPATRFFDISGIFDEDLLEPDDQADRIAYVLGRVKSAAAVSRLEDEMPLVVPWQLYDGGNLWSNKQARILGALVNFEKQSSLVYFGSALPPEMNGNLKSAKTQHTIKDLAKQGICLSLSDFAVVCGASQKLANEAESYAKTAFARLAKQDDLETTLSENPFHFEVRFPEAPGKALFSMSPESARKRAWLDTDYQEKAPIKQAVENQAAEALADLHALYRLGFAASLEKSAKVDLIFSTIARHNRFQ